MEEEQGEHKKAAEEGMRAGIGVEGRTPGRRGGGGRQWKEQKQCRWLSRGLPAASKPEEDVNLKESSARDI